MNISINEHFKTLVSKSHIKNRADYRHNTVSSARYL